MDLIVKNNVAVESRLRKIDKCERVHSVPCTFHADHGASLERHQIGAVATTAVVNGRTPFTIAVVTCERVHRHPCLFESTTSCHGRRVAKSQTCGRGLRTRSRDLVGSSVGMLRRVPTKASKGPMGPYTYSPKAVRVRRKRSAVKVCPHSSSYGPNRRKI